MRKMLALVNLEKQIWQWLVLLFLAFIWGTSFILMKKGLLAFDSLQVAAMRMFFGFLFLLPFALKNLKKLNPKTLKSLLIVGVIGNALPALFYTIAQKHINSSLAGMLNASTPLFTLLVGVVFYKSKIKTINIFGIFIALAGTLMLIIKDFSDITSGLNVYAGIVLLATLGYGTSANEIKNNLKDLSGVQVASLALFLVGPLSGLYLLFTDFSMAVQSPDFYQSLWAIILLSFFSTSLAVVIFNHLIKYTTAIFAASVTYIIPFFALFWGALDGEKILFSQLVWMLVVLIGVYWVNKKD